MEERNQVQVEAEKLVLGSTGEPIANQALIDTVLSLTHPA